MTSIIAVTACPSGVAHTYMAAEAIEAAAKAKGWSCQVETQGSIGIENELDESTIKTADVVILTKDIDIKNAERFTGKTIVRIGVSDAVKRASAVMDKIEKHLESVAA
ncbi:PTS fructose-like transporter subunit IIB [Vibrio harveyi]|uniref:PTS fructose-like transporter subunit IIB n=1 Tax=Vibrio TaxID=662 RepID=UPI000DF39BCF|nr:MULTISPECIES: PTS fructose-like transporter subunit IIB [Vibrio]ELV8721435.1 PTS fructose-like transporter subunit IIB [Vibrio harveyi]RCR61558.1 PTS fructose-like transporter subunit IIB [Vibrio harveyi]USD55853.1 PTS fructose-like transporter subunit IIB [Vibrio sp. SCSIO 43155]